MIERVCVVGAGAIGSLYAGHLAGVASVAVLTRRKEQAHALATEGLRISGKQDFTALVEASDDPAELADADLVIVATKATQLEEAAARLAGRLPGAAVMTVQNGLGAEEVVRRHGDWPLDLGRHLHERRPPLRHPRRVRARHRRPGWAPTPAPIHASSSSRRCTRCSSTPVSAAKRSPTSCRPSGRSSSSTRRVNTVAALTELPHVALFAREEEPTDLGHLVHDLVDEGKRVAAAAGVSLYEDPWEMNVHAVERGETAKTDYAHVPSMLEDVLARRPTEVDSITGALVREAERLGVPTPLHSAMYRLVKGKEASW